jgi:hypothetical protein
LGAYQVEEEFWKPSDDLKGHIERWLLDIGGDLLARNSVNAFFQLSGAKLWRPEKLLLGEISYVIDIGLPLSILGLNRLTKEYLDQINESVSVGKRVPPKLWSEIEVATILKHYGAEVEFVPRGPRKTPDLRAHWTPNTPVEIEVTRGEVRHLHKSVIGGVEDFVQTLRPGDLDWHIVCFVTDASDPEILAAAFDAAIGLQPGQSREESNCWFVRAVALEERNIVVGGQVAELLGPDWWPKDEPTRFSNSTLINGKGNPVVSLRSLYPETSYMNPLIRKANHGQHTDGVPYIIALNASVLPRAHVRMKDEILLNFAAWDHVSGVLIYYPLFYTGAKKKIFKFHVFENPGATSAMPPELLCLANKEINDIDFKISSK